MRTGLAPHAGRGDGECRNDRDPRATLRIHTYLCTYVDWTPWRGDGRSVAMAAARSIVYLPPCAGAHGRVPIATVRRHQDPLGKEDEKRQDKYLQAAAPHGRVILDDDRAPHCGVRIGEGEAVAAAVRPETP